MFFVVLFCCYNVVDDVNVYKTDPVSAFTGRARSVNSECGMLNFELSTFSFHSSVLYSGEGGVCLVDSSGALGEEFFLDVVEVEFDDLLDAVAAEDTGNADAEVFLTVFAVEEG